MDYLQQNLRATNSSTVYCIQQVYKILGATLPNMGMEDRQLIRYVSLISDNYLLLPLSDSASVSTQFCFEPTSGEFQFINGTHCIRL